MKKLIFAAVAVMATIGTTHAEEITSQSKLTSATILRSGVELTHTAKVKLASGNNEVIIEGLSSNVNQNSIKISCTGGVTVMGSEFKTDYLKQPKVSAKVQQLTDSVEFYKNEMILIEAALTTNMDLKQLLKDNRAIGGAQTGVEVGELMKMLEYYESKSNDLENDKIDLNRRKLATELKLRNFSSQLSTERGKASKPIGKLELNLMSPMARESEITVYYFSNSAYWTPIYDIVSDGVESPLKITSKAIFRQNTGLDWQNVKVNLSTTVPNNGRIAPVLNAWFINYYDPYQHLVTGLGSMKSRGPVESLAQNSMSYSEELSDVTIRGSGSAKKADPLYVVDGEIMSAGFDVNNISPDMIESISVLKDASATSVYGSRGASGVIVVELKKSMVTQTETDKDVTYAIDLPYNKLESGKEQSVVLNTIEMPAKYEYLCVPHVDNTVYLMASVTDWAKYNLMAGEAAITYAGTYAGKSHINPNTKSVLNLTMGNDNRVLVKREKMQDLSSTRTIGNEKRQQFTYQITVKNNKNMAIDMILKDQVPISSDKSIVVEVLESDGAHVNNEVGTLTWEFKLGAGESRTVKMSYSVKYAKDKTLDGLWQ